jgi:hypothetical protein
MERGGVAPGFDTLSDFAKALGVEVRDFFEAGPFAASEGREDPLVRLVSRLTSLDDDDVEWADKLIEVALARKSRR